MEIVEMSIGISLGIIENSCNDMYIYIKSYKYMYGNYIYI